MKTSGTGVNLSEPLSTVTWESVATSVRSSSGVIAIGSKLLPPCGVTSRATRSNGVPARGSGMPRTMPPPKQLSATNRTSTPLRSRRDSHAFISLLVITSPVAGPLVP